MTTQRAPLFTPVRMRHVSVFVLEDDSRAAALALARHGVFDPEDDADLAERLPGRPGASYRDHHRRAVSRLTRILAHYDLPLSPADSGNFEPVEFAALADLAERLEALWRECARAEDERRELTAKRDNARRLLASLDLFAELDVDLGELRSSGRFLETRVGTVPTPNVARLGEALALSGFLIRPFAARDDLTHAVVVGPRGDGEEPSATLSVAGWQATTVPPEFSERPQAVRRKLEDMRADAEAAVAERAEAVARRREALANELTAAADTLKRAAPFARLSGIAAYGKGAITAMSGWIPADALDGLRAALADALERPFAVSARAPTREEAGCVPSVSRHPRWLAPFVGLVRTYGVVRYGEVDPTWLFAVTFLLMFGMMFGDVGQGAVIAVAGLLARRRWPRVGTFLIAAGVSSTLFGVLYGSVFGLEHVIEPLWMAPLSDPTRLLTIGLGWGIFFISAATLLAAVNRLRAERWRAALLDRNGLAGLLFFLGLVGCAYQFAMAGAADLLPILVVAIGLTLIAGNIAWQQQGPVGERAMFVGVGILETVLAFFSNTLSFLRVAAFSLNHAALAFAVLTLAGMMGQIGHIITLVLGNVFIIIVEGGIVVIQVLRLEFYEGFSRFYSGDGRPFRPLRATLEAPA